MVRAAAFSGILLALLAVPAMAGEASASFTAGIVIGGPASAKAAVTRSQHLRTYSWGAAAISLARAGFAAPRRLGSDGKRYWFTAARGATRFRVAVSISSGAILEVIPA